MRDEVKGAGGLLGLTVRSLNLISNASKMASSLLHLELETPQDCELYRDFLQEIETGWRAKVTLGLARQERIAKAMQDADKVWGDDVREIACVDSDVYWEMRRLYGEDCWKDGDFFKDMMKKNPAMRVNTTSRKTMVRTPGLGGLIA